MEWNIVYVVLQDFEATPRFSNDPIYELAFK